MTRSTRSRVSARTIPGLFSTLDTVWRDPPAAVATSVTVGSRRMDPPLGRARTGASRIVGHAENPPTPFDRSNERRYRSGVAPAQPFLHRAEVVLRAPAQAWSGSDGSFTGGVEGLWVSDVRVLSGLVLTVAGTELEHVRADRMRADRIRFTALLR